MRFSILIQSSEVGRIVHAREPSSPKKRITIGEQVHITSRVVNEVNFGAQFLQRVSSFPKPFPKQFV